MSIFVRVRRELIDYEKLPTGADCLLGWCGDFRRSASVDIMADSLRDEAVGKITSRKPTDPSKPSLKDLAILDMVIK